MHGVSAALAAQFKEGRLVGALLGLTCGRLRRAGAKVLALAAAYAAGTLRLRPSKERPYRPRTKTPPEAQEAPKAPPVPDRPKLPTGFGWLIKRSRVAFGRSQMDYLLAQPDMQALIAAVPPIAHHLRPICRMLGGETPARPVPRAPQVTTAAPRNPAREARVPAEGRENGPAAVALSGAGVAADPRRLRTPTAASARPLVLSAHALPLQTGLKQAAGHACLFCSIYGTFL